jgi:hypothetical protein
LDGFFLIGPLDRPVFGLYDIFVPLLLALFFWASLKRRHLATVVFPGGSNRDPADAIIGRAACPDIRPVVIGQWR